MTTNDEPRGDFAEGQTDTHVKPGTLEGDFAAGEEKTLIGNWYCTRFGDAWKAADAAARTIEREVHEAWRRHERGVGAPPSRSMLREMASQRHDAREKLLHAIGLLHDAGYIQAVPVAARRPRVRAISQPLEH